ncbi:DsrE family protein [Cryobacterium tagatosivorans]|nr:DsrE family protein [Cryobacterium tagatosivorans]
MILTTVATLPDDRREHPVQLVIAVGRLLPEIRCCSTCMDARGITDTMLTEAATRSTMEALADWTIAADKVLVF